MKKEKPKLKPSALLAFCVLHSAFCLAAVPLRFAADADTPRTYQASAYRGETLDIEARLLWRGAPLAVTDGAEAAMCWQTNGMGDAWWTAPASVTTGGVVTATWSPSNDVGAASYRVFFRVAGPGGASYRANMLLRLLGSPGETPNALPLPVQVLDFARISYTNEPWAAAGLSTNDVREIVDGVVESLTPADIGAAPIERPEFEDSIEIDGNDGNPYIALGRQGNVPKLTFFKDYVLIFDDDGKPHSIYYPLKNPGVDDYFALESDIPSTNGFLRTESDPSFSAWKPRRELHADMATNIVWKNVYSNGWVYLMPYSNNLEDAE